MRTHQKYSGIAACALMALVLAFPIALPGQMRGRRGNSSGATPHPEAFKGVVATFSGTLKKLTKKEIVIDLVDSHEFDDFSTEQSHQIPEQ